eukprot:scaffold2682_cov155-Amphora_coffeaeformis.AAC.3
MLTKQNRGNTLGSFESPIHATSAEVGRIALTVQCIGMVEAAISNYRRAFVIRAVQFPHKEGPLNPHPMIESVRP